MKLYHSLYHSRLHNRDSKGDAPFGSFGIFSVLTWQCGSENSLMGFYVATQVFGVFLTRI